MFPEFSAGTFLWQWFHSLAPLHGMVLAMIVGVLAVFMTKWTPVRWLVKVTITAGVLSSMPLGFARMGLELPVYNDQVLTYLSFFGTVLAISVGTPYIFYHVLRAAAGKHYKYVGETVQFAGPQGGHAGNNTPLTREGTGPIAKEPVGQNTLDFTAGPRVGQTVNIGAKTISIGRSPDNDIVVDDPTVSRHHARITVQDGKYQVQDLSSTSGTRVSGKDVTFAQIASGDTIKLGNTEIGFNGAGQYQEKFPGRDEVKAPVGNPGDTRIINKPAAALAWLAMTSGSDTGSTYKLREGSNHIGREPGDGLSVDDQYMSRKHAVIRVENGAMILYDFGSTGGTRVNGKEIGARIINANSVIRVGETELKVIEVDNPKQFAQATMSGKTKLDLRGEHVAALMITSGMDAGKSLMLTEGDNTLGRGPSCSVGLSDDSVSREHAVIRCRDGKLSVFDLGSTAGTSIDGQNIGGIRLNNGDVISMGRSEFTMMAAKAQPVGV